MLCFTPSLPSRQHGFSLVEVALALAIMGLIGAMTYPLLAHLLTQQKVNRTETILETARDEVLGYAMGAKMLPADISAIGHQIDAWRSGLVYKKSEDVGADLCVFFQANGISPLRIETLGGGSVANVAFILISTGPNKTLEAEVTGDVVTIRNPGELVGNRKYDDVHVFLTVDYLRAKVLPLCPLPSE